MLDFDAFNALPLFDEVPVVVEVLLALVSAAIVMGVDIAASLEL